MVHVRSCWPLSMKTVDVFLLASFVVRERLVVYADILVVDLSKLGFD